MKRRSKAGLDHLHQTLSELKDRETTVLRDQFRGLYGVEPPARLARALLILAISYRLQEAALGGLKASVRRSLMDHVPVVNTPPRLRSGSLLVREWQGVRHTVTVLEKGFRYEEQSYRSLSEITRHITGQVRSGPRFFGVKTHGGD